MPACINKKSGVAPRWGCKNFGLTYFSSLLKKSKACFLFLGISFWLFTCWSGLTIMKICIYT